MKWLFIITIVMLETTAAADPTAEDHFHTGQAAYNHGDYQTAINEWRAAYQLSGENDLLFNIAQADRLSGDCQEALSTYKKFLAADLNPAASQHKIAEDFVRDLELTCRTAAPPSPPVRLPPVVTHPGRSLKIAGVATAAGGAALIAGGVVLGLHASSLANEVSSACQASCYWPDWKNKDAAGRRDQTIGLVLDGVGAAAIVGGAALYYLGMRQSNVVVTPHEGGMSVSWGGSW